MNAWVWLKSTLGVPPTGPAKGGPPEGQVTQRRADSSPRYDRYRKMRLDPQLRLGLAVIKGPIAGAAWDIECDDQAIQAWITDEIARIWRPMTRRMLRAVEFGHAEAEKVFETGDDGLYHVDDLADLEPQLVRFFKDDQGKLSAISYTGQPQLGPEKFLHLAVDEEYGDPHGNSRLKPAEEQWERSRAIYRNWDVYLERKAIPQTIGRAPAEKMIDPATGAEFSPMDKLDEGIKAMRSGGWSTLPDSTDAKGNYRYQITELPTAQRGGEFLSAADYVEAMKLRALLVPERTVTQSASGTGTYSMVEAQTDTFMGMEEELLADFIDCVQGLIDQLVRINWGAQAAKAIISTKPLSKDVQNLVRQIFTGLANSSPDTFVRILDLIRLCEMHNIPLVADAAAKLAKLQNAPPAAAPLGFGGVRLRRNDDGEIEVIFGNVNLARSGSPDDQARAQTQEADRVYQPAFHEAVKFFADLKAGIAATLALGIAPGGVYAFDGNSRTEYVKLLTQAMLSADLAGRARVVKALPADVKLKRGLVPAKPGEAGDANLAGAGGDFPLLDDPGSVFGSFSTDFAKQAAAFLYNKQAMTIADFNALAEGYRDRAFSIAGDFSTELTGKVRDALGQTVAEGGTRADFAKALDNLFDSEGLTRLSPGRIETIFQTNVLSAYGNGQREELQSSEVAPAFPLYRVYCLMVRTRPSHLEMNGRIFAADDPLWGELWTPFDFGCHCTILPIARSQAEAENLQPTQERGWRPELLMQEREQHGFA